MATSKRIRKRKVATYFTKYVGRWFYKTLIHKGDLHGLFDRELRTSRMRKKCIELIDYANMKPLRRRWSVPIVNTNPCKKSRIKKHCDSYRIVKPEDVTTPDGKFSYTHDELMNLYLSNGGSDE